MSFKYRLDYARKASEAVARRVERASVSLGPDVQRRGVVGDPLADDIVLARITAVGSCRPFENGTIVEEVKRERHEIKSRSLGTGGVSVSRIDAAIEVFFERLDSLVQFVESSLLFEIHPHQRGKQRFSVVEIARRIGVLARILEEVVEAGLINAPEAATVALPAVTNRPQRIAVRRRRTTHLPPPSQKARI